MQYFINMNYPPCLSNSEPILATLITI